MEEENAKINAEPLEAQDWTLLASSVQNIWDAIQSANISPEKPSVE